MSNDLLYIACYATDGYPLEQSEPLIIEICESLESAKDACEKQAEAPLEWDTWFKNEWRGNDESHNYYCVIAKPRPKDRFEAFVEARIAELEQVTKWFPKHRLKIHFALEMLQEIFTDYRASLEGETE